MIFGLGTFQTFLGFQSRLQFQKVSFSKVRNRKTGSQKNDENNLATLPATVTLPPGLWEGTEEEFEARLEAAAGWVNQHHDVDGLCKEMPRRMHDAGDRTESKELMS